MPTASARRVTRTERTVTLVSGEAYFEVAHDPERPFTVLAGNSVVRAEGTLFTVRVRDRSTIGVYVAEGSVSVETRGEQPVRRIAAGVYTQFASNGALQRTEPRKPEEMLSWLEGKLVFNGQSLAEVAEEFNRYSRRKVVIDPRDASRRIGGMFSIEDPERFALTLSNGLNTAVELRAEDGTVVRFAHGSRQL